MIYLYIVSLIIAFIIASFLGVRVLFGAIAVGSIAWLAYSWHEEKSKSLHTKDAQFDQVVPDNVENRVFEPISDADMNLLVVPQDAPFQVSYVDHDFKHVPMHPVLVDAFKVLGDGKQRRRVALKISLGTLERFLAIYEYLKEKKLLKIGNSLKHERLKQRFSDMAMLRSECLEQLHSTLYDFKSTNTKFSKSIETIRDYTQYLYAEIVSRWIKVIPGIGDGSPPHGLSTIKPKLQDATSIYRF